MQVTRFNQAQPYSAPGHHNMVGLRLQGEEASATDHFWVGYSQFLPGGGAHMGATPFEKVYVVLNGEIVITTDAQEVVLKANDSCRIAPDEQRRILNKTNTTVSMLVIIPNAKELSCTAT